MQQIHSLICHLLRIALVLFALESVAFGQITNVTDDQSTPLPGTGHDYMKMLDETVNPANGSVSIRVGVPVPPGRGLTLPFAFSYDSNGALHLATGNTQVGNLIWTSNGGPNSGGGWSNTLPQLTWSYLTATDNNGNACDYVTDFVFQDADGGRHFFQMTALIDTYSQCQEYFSNIATQFSGQDDFYTSVATQPNASLVMVFNSYDGTAYSFEVVPTPSSAYPTWMEDRNGNQVTFTPPTPWSPLTVTDTLGRTALSLSPMSGYTQTVDVSGLASPYQVTYGTASANFPAPQQTVNLPPPACYNGAVPAYSGGTEGITAIELPNGQQYSFTYESTYGRLSQITYPTGAWVKYTWGLSPNAQSFSEPNRYGFPICTYTYDFPAVTERQVSFDGVNVALDQHFSYSTNWSIQTYKTTQVTSIDKIAGNTTITVYTYDPAYAPTDINDLPYAGQVPVENTITYEDGNGNPLRTVNKTWSDASMMICESTTESPNQNPMTLRTDYLPGMGVPLADKKEWNWGGQDRICGNTPTGSPLRETQTSFEGFSINYWPPFVPAPMFYLPTTVATYYNGGPTPAAEITYGYDGGSLASGSTTVGRDLRFNGGSINARGNVTSKTAWLNTGQSPLTTYTYDDTGQVVSMTDPCGNANCSDIVDSDHTTQYHYSNYNAYLSEVDYPSTSGVPHKRYFSYNSGDGQLASASDQNNPPNYTNYKYNDSLGRLTEIDYPDGGKTTYGFGSSCGQPTTSTKLLSGSSTYVENSVLDEVCHVTETAVTDPESPGVPLKMDATYDGFGRAWIASNPYRTKSDTTYGVTTTTYDPLGRVTMVSNPDGSYSSTVYGTNCSAQPGYCYTFTDAANKTRRLWNDGVGRLTAVSEDPNNSNYPTTYNYTYNSQGEQFTVSQSGQTRSSTFDSLSRLTQAQNPESNVSGTQCATNYNYDANGNVFSKVAPLQNQNASCSNPVTTSYGYDALNRLVYKNYTDPFTVRANYAYDGIYGWGDTMVNPIGHLTSSWSVQHDGTVVAANEFYLFDAMGRVQESRQCTPATCGLTSYQVQAGYDLMGNEINLWESSLARYFTYDAASRLSSMSATSNISPPQLTATGPGSQTLINISAHSPFGGLSTAALGNGLAETRNYTNRGWLGSIGVGSVYSLSMGYAGNGAVTAANDSENGNWIYGYDNVNRLQTASGNGQSFSYNVNPNPWGNMTCTNTGNLPCTPQGLSFSAATNQITTSGYTYDAAGNLMTDNTHGYLYDAENRIICVVGTDGTCTSASAMLYLYDAGGQRVGKQQADTLEDYVYGPEGRIISVHDGSANLVRTELYSPEGRHMATWEGSNWSTSNLFLNHADWLGNERVRSDINGNIAETCTDTPYGMNLTCEQSPQTDISPMHFTGKQRDYESGLDNFGARYFGGGNNLGRFMTPDWSATPEPVPYMRLDNPQTLNLYVYLRNNPLSTTDPDGHTDIAQDDLCGDRYNCTQSSPDKNGNVTVTVTTHSSTPPVDNGDGSFSATTTTTTSNYVFDRTGSITNASNQESTTVTSTVDQGGNATNTSKTTTASLNESDARAQFGGTDLTNFQNSMMDSNTKGFLGQVAADAKAHPYMYATFGFGLVSGGFGLAAEEVGTASAAYGTLTFASKASGAGAAATTFLGVMSGPIKPY